MSLSSSELLGAAAAVSEYDSMALDSSMAGCVGEPLDLKGAALVAAASYAIYLGYGTKTNKKREAVEGPGVQRRAFLVTLGLQGGAALFRRSSGMVCSDAELERWNRAESVEERRRIAQATD